MGVPAGLRDRTISFCNESMEEILNHPSYLKDRDLTAAFGVFAVLKGVAEFDDWHPFVSSTRAYVDEAQARAKAEEGED